MAITDCLNFGSPERPEIMWQFAECIRGISDACRALETPVVSGNVSFYNETEGRAVYPTPTVGMVGILESDRDGCGLAFADADLDVILLGDTRDELGGSEVAADVRARRAGRAAARRSRCARRRSIELLLVAARRRKLLRSAHDLSNGGLAVALAEMSMDGIGCHVDLGGHADDLDAIALLFSESQARAIVACTRRDRERVLAARREARRAPHSASATPRTARSSSSATACRSSASPRRSWRASGASSFALLLGGDTIDEVLRGVGEEAPEVMAH